MQFTANPAELFDAIEVLTAIHPKAFGRMGVSRPTGIHVLGLAATGRLAELSAADTEGSLADVILTGDQIKDLPAECVATWNKRKISTYALIGAHVAAVLGFKPGTIESLGKVPGTSAPTVQKLLSDLPEMEEYRKEIEARRKAAAKHAADKTAVKSQLQAAKDFGISDPTEAHFARIMADRDLSWEQVSGIIGELTKDADAATKADATADA
ncbi:hypothetical protein ACQP1V_43235 (plasmid) [Microtetraspora malaysiensis]|uniref:hypothetical protein n=1 Tax=Microtetraspora malaysiensis TaxID=161358 RepID=UPI003D9134A7